MKVVAALTAIAATTQAASLSDICSVARIQSALPSNGTIENVYMIPSSVSATAVYNASTSTGGMMKRQADTSSSTTTYNYCNVTATYTHGNDSVIVWYGFPEPGEFQNRFYVGGGGGYSLASGVTGGLEYGAASGCTDAGYDAFTNSLDEVVLIANGSINWQNVKMVSGADSTRASQDAESSAVLVRGSW